MPALRNILVAVRPGSLDSHPLRSAMALATRARARLSGLSVAPSPRARAHIESTLAEGIPMHTALGIPAIEIVREAESKGTDLLVLGRELSPQMDLRHDGNTVEGTVRRARIPCLVVPRGQEKFGRVLAAVDGGPDSRDVMAAALLVSTRRCARSRSRQRSWRGWARRPGCTRSRRPAGTRPSSAREIRSRRSCAWCATRTWTCSCSGTTAGAPSAPTRRVGSLHGCCSAHLARC